MGCLLSRDDVDVEGESNGETERAYEGNVYAWVNKMPTTRKPRRRDGYLSDVHY